MEKLLKSLDKYLSYHMPQYIEKKNYAEAQEGKDGNVSIVFWSGRKEVGRTKPRPKQEVEEYLTCILYSPEVNDLLVGSASDMLCFVTCIILKETKHAVAAEGLFASKNRNYYPAMMLDEMFTAIHEALNG
jgi:hypothetical protein